ncbi:hypothetical protein [Mitsuokella multacida]
MPAKLQLWNTDLHQLPSDDALGPFTPIFLSNIFTPHLDLTVSAI